MGCLHVKTAPLWVLFRYYVVISYPVYMKGWDSIWHLHEGQGHFTPAKMCWKEQICDCDAILGWMSKTMHAKPVPDTQESDFSNKQSYHLNMTSEWVSYQNENLATVQWPGWTRTCLTHSGMRFCAGILLMNTEPQEETRMNLHQNESRTGII